MKRGLIDFKNYLRQGPPDQEMHPQEGIPHWFQVPRQAGVTLSSQAAVSSREP